MIDNKIILGRLARQALRQYEERSQQVNRQLSTVTPEWEQLTDWEQGAFITMAVEGAKWGWYNAITKVTDKYCLRCNAYHNGDTTYTEPRVDVNGNYYHVLVALGEEGKTHLPCLASEIYTLLGPSFILDGSYVLLAKARYPNLDKIIPLLRATLRDSRAEELLGEFGPEAIRFLDELFQSIPINLDRKGNGHGVGDSL